MTEIAHTSLKDFLGKTAPDGCPQVWMIHGLEALVEKAVAEVRQHLLGDNDKGLCSQTIDGFAQNVPTLLAELNTFALLADTKVVVFNDAKLFEGRASQQKLVGQIETAWEEQQAERAAKTLVSLCEKLEVAVERVPHFHGEYPELETLYQSLGKEVLGQLVALCVSQGWTADGAEGQLQTLQLAVEKGFPQGHFLLIGVNSKVPKNLKFSKTVQTHGVAVDCSVPMGERRADKDVQQAVLRQAMEEILSRNGKRLAPRLFGELVALTGFDVRVFCQNLEKLVTYVGEREEIVAGDIHALLRRTKSDPLFQLTGAVADRNGSQALFFAQSLLADQWHALQLLAAIANQIRKLLIAKDFTTSSFGRDWDAGLPYSQFQRQVMPAVQAYDEHIASQVIPWPAKKGQQKAKQDTSADMRLAPNPKNAFPVFQTLLKSAKFTREELIAALYLLNDADVRLKSTGQDPTIIIKKLIMDICHSDPKRKKNNRQNTSI